MIRRLLAETVALLAPRTRNRNKDRIALAFAMGPACKNIAAAGDDGPDGKRFFAAYQIATDLILMYRNKTGIWLYPNDSPWLMDARKGMSEFLRAEGLDPVLDEIFDALQIHLEKNPLPGQPSWRNPLRRK